MHSKCQGGEDKTEGARRPLCSGCRRKVSVITLYNRVRACVRAFPGGVEGARLKANSGSESFSGS